jgi:hypothetical protein
MLLVQPTRDGENGFFPHLVTGRSVHRRTEPPPLPLPQRHFRGEGNTGNYLDYCSTPPPPHPPMSWPHSRVDDSYPHLM